MSDSVLHGVVSRQFAFYWHVETDAEEDHLKTIILRGQDFDVPPEIGMKVKLKYVRTASAGLWKARKA